MTTTLRARFDGKVLIPVGKVDLPAGQEVELRVTSVGEFQPGSAHAILQAVSQQPHLANEDVDELEKHIRAGTARANPTGVFDDLK